MQVLDLRLCALQQHGHLAALLVQTCLLGGKYLVVYQSAIGHLHEAQLVVLETLELGAVASGFLFGDLLPLC
ncbi:hypothetical protein LRS13_12525 [Svornostia abyssi]|uniref:Secreted protein n=1 Tax=Svornostia abyssi TaxID=2898438 RepID=A0ABY5PA00_9ACTN|nr:hypothetical protein LRS13_12525 [Parviterribacteraceae bacterium J379]